MIKEMAEKMSKRYYLGIDCGSVSLKLVVMDEERAIIWKDYQRTYGEPLKQLHVALGKMLRNEKISELDYFEGIYTTGSGRFTIGNLFGCEPINEITTHGMAGASFYPEAKTIIEIGGQDSKLILLDKLDDGQTVIVDSQMNDICAAGTGSFLDQQAYRMGLTVEKLSAKACLARNPAKISGRCSVFAKTDMIHMQQNGISIEDLSAGVCMAVARTYIENLVKGREIKTPILFQGGVAQNTGVKKAFVELLKLKENDIIIPENFSLMGAIGAILHGLRKNTTNKITKEELISKILANAHTPLKNTQLKSLSHANIITEQHPVMNVNRNQSVNVYVGIDVGSVSAKIVLIDEGRNIVFKYYTTTEGEPIEAVKECFRQVKDNYPRGVNVKGVGVTGSGRDYIANYVKADVVKNEITAQTKGTTMLVPDVNNIIEIGGQDSKFIRIQNGVIVDFVMNKTCAAGTGSFLAEQADRFKNELDKFSEMAFGSKKPLDMGTRCTVFMETDCIHYQQMGHEKEDILAGLSYSIAKNYIEKVAGNQPIEGKVVIQGGIAFNRSVVAAFGNLLGTNIMIAPHHEVTGALGIAYLAEQEMSKGRKTQFVGFDIENRILQKKVIECKECANVCSLVFVKYNDDNQSIYGGICGKFEKDKMTGGHRVHDYFEDRKNLLLSFDRSKGNGKGRIGIPRILLFHELFPMWVTFFNTLGYDVVLSQELSKSVYEKGIAKVLVDTCFPIRCVYGAVVDLIELGVDKIFIPYVLNMKDDGYPTKYAHNCQYVQQAADFIKSAIDVEVLTTTIRMNESQKNIEDTFVKLGRELDILDLDSKRAFHEAVKVQSAFTVESKNIGENALADFKKFNKVFVLIGHSYIIHDKFFNLNLVKQLAKLGIPAIAADMLQLENNCDKARKIDLAWKTNNRAVNAIEFIHEYNLVNKNRLIPIIMTQFGCAADSMLTPYLKDLLGNNPWMEVEVDEHNSITGLMTRCEAFWESVSSESREEKAFENTEQLFSNNISLSQLKEEDRKVYIFSMCEAFAAISEVFTRHGIRSEMIDKTTDYSNNLGRKYSNEKHCRTYQVVMGDFLATTQKQDFDANKAAMFMIGYDEACRVALFNSLCPKVLRECGAGDVKMFGVTVDDPLEWMGVFGLNMANDLWTAMVAADYLSRYSYQLRPYEKEKGSINRVYKEAKAVLYKSIREGKVSKGLKQSLEMLKRVPRVVRDLVYIGVVGDAFTRVHEYGMTEIFEIVEEMNGVIMLPPSWHDFINYGAERRVTDLWRKGNYAKSIVTKVGSTNLNILRRNLHNISAAYSEMFDEPDNSTLTEYAREYVNVNVAPVIPSMFIGKTVDFVKRKKVDGLINCYGFNCSLGKIATACISKIRADSDNVPMLTFIDDGLQQTNIKTRVEAFMEQAWAYKKKGKYRAGKDAI
jgi:predicted CoA-substrate-specific enzyme activase